MQENRSSQELSKFVEAIKNAPGKVSARFREKGRSSGKSREARPSKRNSGRRQDFGPVSR